MDDNIFFSICLLLWIPGTIHAVYKMVKEELNIWNKIVIVINCSLAFLFMLEPIFKSLK